MGGGNQSTRRKPPTGRRPEGQSIQWPKKKRKKRQKQICSKTKTQEIKY
jgi:hypothetical protein